MGDTDIKDVYKRQKYETVNKKIDDNKIDSDRKVENMEKQLERLREGNNTRFEKMQEQAVETKQDVRKLESYIISCTWMSFASKVLKTDNSLWSFDNRKNV